MVTTLSLGRGSPKRPTAQPPPLPPLAQVASPPSLAPEHVSPSTSALPSPEQLSPELSELSPSQVASPSLVSLELSPSQLASPSLVSPELSFGIGMFWLVYCVYSWVVPPLVRRWLRRR